jgi:hypothetical protein
LLASPLAVPQFSEENIKQICCLRKVIAGTLTWHHSCYTQRVTRKPKITAKSSGLAKPGPKRSSGIRLDDLMPKKRITGGKGLLFGASDNPEPPMNQPRETT